MYILSKTQEEIVNHKEGPALVLAGPGSGKTTVIAGRTVRLEREVTSPQNILTLCFGRDAAEEMRKRYIKLRGNDNKPQAVFSTVHSICLKILSERKSNGYSVLEEKRKISVLLEIYKKINGTSLTDGEQLAASVSRQRNIEAYGKKIIPQIYKFGEICEEYNKYKIKNRLIDYDDMIFKGLETLKQDDKIRKKYSGEYLQADEAQDLSWAQFEIIKLLSENNNIFTVADDDQCIYGFRGAVPDCIVNYDRIFKGAKIYRLEENYRSTENIVDFSSNVVKRNSVRCEKNIFTENEKGDNVEIVRCSDGIFQSRYVVKKVTENLKKRPGETNGILYRNNMSGISVMLCLTEAGIPFEVSGNYPEAEKEYIVREFLRESENAEKHGMIIPSPGAIYKKMIRDGLISKALLMCELTGRQKRTVYSLADFLKILSSSSNSYDECRKKLELIGNHEGRKGEKTGVFLTTVHSAKGLEYDNVFVIDLVKDEFPGKGAYSGELLEEERRLFFVAVSRAKKRLCISYPEKRGGMKEEKSIFIKEAEENSLIAKYNC